MIQHNIEQRSNEWYKLRWGMITGSAVKDLFAGTRAQQTMYASLSFQRENPDEWEISKDGFDNKAMEWGRDHEDQAVCNLELDRMVDVIRSPVLQHSDIPLLVSLDGITEENEPVEIKCPYNPNQHKSYCANGMGNHMYQLLAGMVVTGASTGLFMSYDPRDGLKKCHYETLARNQDLAAELMHRVIEMDRMVNDGSFAPFVSESLEDIEGFPALF